MMAPDGRILGESVINEIDWDLRCANFRIQYFIPQIVDRESVPGPPKQRVILRLRSESGIAWNGRLTRFIPVRKNISESRIP